MAGVERLELPVAVLEAAGLPLTDTPMVAVIGLEPTLSCENSFLRRAGLPFPHTAMLIISL